MSKPLVITSSDLLLEHFAIETFISGAELGDGRIVPFFPRPGANLKPWISILPGVTELTAQKGDFLISEVDAPNDYWPIDPVIFEESYVIIRPGYCVKSAITLLVPLTDITNGAEDQMVTVISLEGPLTVRAGDFYLAKGIKGESGLILKRRLMM